MSMVVNESGTASFQCEAEGNPEPEVTWLKQNTSLSVDKRVVSSRGGLMITDVTSQDEGMYTCVARNILGEMTSSAILTVQVGAVISGKPSSVIVEEGQNVSLVCQATGQPTPTVTWSKLALLYHNTPKKTVTNVEGANLSLVKVTKSQGGDYICLAKNLLNQDSALVQVIVLEALKFTILPPRTSLGLTSRDALLPCSAQGALDIVWQRAGQSLPSNRILYSNGSLLLKNISPNYAGSYTCIARNFHRSVKASTSLEVRKPISCSEIKSSNKEIPSGNYMIDPDGNGGVTPFSVYCDMSDKGGVGVTVISHDSESRTHLGPNRCGSEGCYSKDVRYTGVSTAQLAALTQVSQNCKQFIKFECNNEICLLSQVMLGGCHVMEHRWTTGEELQIMTGCAHAE